jgi:hypothetical protein
MSHLGYDPSFGHVGSMSGLPESGHGWAIYEYMSSNLMILARHLDLKFLNELAAIMIGTSNAPH